MEEAASMVEDRRNCARAADPAISGPQAFYVVLGLTERVMAVEHSSSASTVVVSRRIW